MNSTVRRNSPKPDTFEVEPILRKALKEAKKEHEKLQHMFRLLGWSDLPDALKIEIKDDVAAMAGELEGQYSTCDPFVEKRRQTVTYWVSCYQDGICSLDTAVNALKVKPL